jgi:hypothetical protein
MLGFVRFSGVCGWILQNTVVMRIRNGSNTPQSKAQEIIMEQIGKFNG